jgi:endonuclease YncB( thermonuclease family)
MTSTTLTPLPAITAPVFTYWAEVVRWVDGDTVDLRIDLGFYVTTEQRCRLLGIDTPERGKPGAAEASARVKALAPAGTHLLIRSEKGADKYGRFLVDIAGVLDDVTINRTLVIEKLAVPYYGGTKGVAV